MSIGNSNQLTNQIMMTLPKHKKHRAPVEDNTYYPYQMQYHFFGTALSPSFRSHKLVDCDTRYTCRPKDPSSTELQSNLTSHKFENYLQIRASWADFPSRIQHMAQGAYFFNHIHIWLINPHHLNWGELTLKLSNVAVLFKSARTHSSGPTITSLKYGDMLWAGPLCDFIYQGYSPDAPW